MSRTPHPEGAEVLHVPKKAKGTVVGTINLTDSDDIRRQGIRYVVRHSGWLWSVPEQSLQLIRTLPTPPLAP